MVNPSPAPTSMLGEAGILKAVEVLLKVNAWPTSPGATPIPFTKIAELVPTESEPEPSPRHRLTKPWGTGAQATWAEAPLHQRSAAVQAMTGFNHFEALLVTGSISSPLGRLLY